MAIEIVDLPINSMVIFHSYVNVCQRVLTDPRRETKEMDLTMFWRWVGVWGRVRLKRSWSLE